MSSCGKDNKAFLFCCSGRKATHFNAELEANTDKAIRRNDNAMYILINLTVQFHRGERHGSTDMNEESGDVALIKEIKSHLERPNNDPIFAKAQEHWDHTRNQVQKLETPAQDTEHTRVAISAQAPRIRQLLVGQALQPGPACEGCWLRCGLSTTT